MEDDQNGTQLKWKMIQMVNLFEQSLNEMLWLKPSPLDLWGQALQQTIFLAGTLEQFNLFVPSSKVQVVKLFRLSLIVIEL